MTLELDRRADAAYVVIHDGTVASTRKLDSQRVVDYDAKGEVLGIEFLAISRGVDLADLPYSSELARLFDEHNIRILI